MTYAYDALHRVSTSSDISGRLLLDLAIVVGVTGAALVLGAATLPRRTG